MKKLAPYFKPFIGFLLIVVSLLFLQAFSELNLPNYMSGIVNTGIQQSGIENAAPDVISNDGMALMQSFMTEEERQIVEELYSPYSEANYPKAYPVLGKSAPKDLLVKDEKIEEDQQQKLNKSFGTATYTMRYTIEELLPDQEDITAEELEELDFTPLYAEILPMVQNIPAMTLKEAHNMAVQVPESMREQTGAAFTKAFYNELGIDVYDLQQSYIINTGLIMLAIAGLAAGASIAVGFFSSRIAAGVARNLRRDLFEKVESFSLAEYNRFSTASLITRTTNDITQIQTFVTMGVRMLLFAPIMGVGGVVMALDKSASMAWIIALAVIVMLGLILITFAIALPKFKIIQKLIDRVNLVSREQLSGMQVVRAFGTQEYEEKRFDKANQELSNTQLFINKLVSIMFPGMTFVMDGVGVLIVWIGAQQIEQATIQVGDMMAYTQYAMIIIMSFLMIAMIFIMIPRASVSAARIAEVLEVEPEITDPKVPQSFDEEERGVVVFDKVHFRYGGAENDVLCNLSFTARPGETTAFIGSTGSGKSTLINLVPRFYDVTSGKVKVSGRDVRDVPLHDLREEIGYVPQQGTLFSGTIASNLRYGDEEASDKEIKEAAEIAQAMEFIDENKRGVDAPISEGGANVSGGQKQRLSIARALVKKAKVYIFDDSFSALDFKTDTKLRQALRPYTEHSTVMIVAQRISTVLHADQIVVLDKGEIVGKGTHDELMEDCPTYIEIAQSQLDSEGLAQSKRS